MSESPRLWKLPALAGVLVLCIDQATKWWAQQAFAAQPLEIFSWLKLTLLYNKGISWSLCTPTTPSGHLILTMVIGILTLLYGLHTLNELRKGQSIFGEALILSGALGNIIDRLVHGAVVDFILLHYGDYSFPVFNVADMVIVFGFLLFVRKGLVHESC